MCSYGFAARAILQAACGYDAARLKGFGARISAPVYPGDVLRTEVWLGGDDAASASDSNTRIVSFRMTVPARDGVVVLNNGRAEIAPGA